MKITRTDLSVYLHDPPTTGNERAALGLLEALQLLRPDPPATRDWLVKEMGNWPFGFLTYSNNTLLS